MSYTLDRMQNHYMQQQKSAQHIVFHLLIARLAPGDFDNPDTALQIGPSKGSVRKSGDSRREFRDLLTWPWEQPEPRTISTSQNFIPKSVVVVFLNTVLIPLIKLPKSRSLQPIA